MRLKRLLAIALITMATPVALPQSSNAQFAEAIGAGACLTSVGCGVIAGSVVVGGVFYYLFNANNGQRLKVEPQYLEIHSQPIPMAGPRPELPREFQSNFYDPATQEFTLARNREGCEDKEKRVRKAHPDWDVWLATVKRNRAPGTFNEALCLWQGRDRKLLKRYYNS